MAIIRKKTEEINMRPSGINWEEEDVCLVTPKDIVHTSKGEKFLLAKKEGESDRDAVRRLAKKPLSDNFVLADTVWSAGGYDINVVEKDDPKDSYVSVVCMTLGRTSNSVSCFEKGFGLAELDPEDRKYGIHYNKGLDNAENSSFMAYGESHSTPAERMGIEIRVYRNKRVSVLHSIKYKENPTVRYYVEKPENGERMSTYKKSNIPERDFFSNGLITEVFTDADVKAASERNSIKDRLIEQVTPMYLGELGVRHCATNGGYRCYKEFPKAVQDELNGFFGVFSPENASVKVVYDVKFPNIKGHAPRREDQGIISLIYLDRWTACNARKASAACEKMKTDKELWDSLTWPTPAEGDDEGRYVTWERRHGEKGDLIIATYIDFCPRKSWGKVSHSAAFIYDVRKKSRKVLRSCARNPLSATEAEISSTIPSLKNCILNIFDLAPKLSWCYETHSHRKVDDGAVQEIVGGISVKELFAGTNIAWILDNEKEFGEDMVYLFDNNESRYGNYAKPRRISEDIREGGKIGIVALCILATTGNAMLEQLLKSRMFRLYFLGLYAEERQTTVFLDVNKKLKGDPRASFRYNSKGKNLKEMFGMSLNQLRMVDKSVEILTEIDKDTDPRYKYSFPNLFRVSEVLGVSRLSDLNDAMMSDVIKIAKDRAEGCCWYMLEAKTTVFERFWERDLEKTVANNTPKERLEFMKTFRNISEVDLMGDYHRMRHDLEVLQFEHPGERIFDERQFPMKVGKAVKFIRFMPGMRAPRSWQGKDTGWHTANEEIKDQNTFIDFIRSEYSKYVTERGSIQLELNEYGKVVGAIVKMNRAQHCVFLHNELAQWYALYSDDSKKEEFEKATRRVADLCWEDEKTGLSIIKPDGLDDLRNEGSVLEHCVASYVHPIISGGHNIMFIRRTDMITEPYYTLDVNDDGDVTEVHGYMNCNMESSDIDKAFAETKREVYSKHFDIKGFLQNWAKAKRGRINAKSIRCSYGKLDIAM